MWSLRPIEVSLASQLCTECGLCCDGTLFDHATSPPWEVARLRALGFTVSTDRARPAFALPCHLLDGACCTIYGERPSKCGAFRCALLKRLDRAEVSLPDAIAVVGKAKALRTDAVSVEPAAATVRTRLARRRAAEGWQALPDPARRQAEARSYLQLVAFDRFLDLHFRNTPVNAFTGPETSRD